MVRYPRAGFFTLIIGRIFRVDHFTLAKVGAVVTRCVLLCIWLLGMNRDLFEALLG